MEQKLVVHRMDGTIFKGVTHDFDPSRKEFHFLPAEGGGVPLVMRVSEMKALFWVKDYLGNRQFVPRRAFDDGASKRAIVTFVDGEELWGMVDGEAGGEHGFFMTPADKRDNNIRVFVVRSALKDLRMVS